MDDVRVPGALLLSDQRCSAGFLSSRILGCPLGSSRPALKVSKTAAPFLLSLHPAPLALVTELTWVVTSACLCTRLKTIVAVMSTRYVIGGDDGLAVFLSSDA